MVALANTSDRRRFLRISVMIALSASGVLESAQSSSPDSLMASCTPIPWLTEYAGLCRPYIAKVTIQEAACLTVSSRQWESLWPSS